MTYATGTAYNFASCGHRRLSRRISLQTITFAVACATGAAALVLILLVRAWTLDGPPAAFATAQALPAVAPTAGVAPAPPNPLLDPAFSLGVAPMSLAESAPLASTFVWVSPPTAVAMEEPDNILPVPMPAVPELVENVPLPPPRAPDLRSRASQGPFRFAGRQIAQQNRMGVVPSAPADNRSFLERLFGMPQRSGPVLAYAAPEDGVFGSGSRQTTGAVAPYDRWSAVYDIAAHTVYMPDGSRLEAHSGLGDRLDDPRHVGERNRGATPPHVYDLEPRAQLFHGVQALRLTPVGNGAVFGRTGLLAHSYMLGPKGDSNGCVSFKDYNAFLRAYMNGAVRRLVVVTSQI